MDQIEKPLSILLIVAAMGYAFMNADAADGYTTIENNTSSGYAIEAAELSTGYNVKAPSTCNYKAVEVHIEDCDLTEVDSLVQSIVDTIWHFDTELEEEVYELVIHPTEKDVKVEVEVEVTTTEEEE